MFNFILLIFKLLQEKETRAENLLVNIENYETTQEYSSSFCFTTDASLVNKNPNTFPFENYIFG